MIIPEDVTVYDSAFGSYFYLRFAGRTVTVAHRYAKGRVVEYEVYQEGFWHNSYHRSLTEALEAAFRKITDMRDMGIAIEHRRDGVHTTNRFTDQSARVELVVGELSSVHRLFVAVAGHLDANSHVLTRSQLDADALLSRASRADTPSRMRTAIAFIVESLREQAAVLDTIAGQRDVDPPRPPRDDSLEERPSTNLTWDARFLRSLASVIEKDAAPRGLKVGDFVVYFRNAINGSREEHVCGDVESAQLLAKTHRPFNNTDVRIRKVISLHYDSPVMDDVVWEFGDQVSVPSRLDCWRTNSTTSQPRSTTSPRFRSGSEATRVNSTTEASGNADVVRRIARVSTEPNMYIPRY
jgi:hypothetical protein